MVASDEIRPPTPAGSGDGGATPAANSSVGTLRETVRSGRATEDTLRIVVPLTDGGELRFHAVHGRVEMQIRLGKGRVWQTTPVTAERAEHYAARLGEIAQHARAQRQAKGA